MIDVVVLGLLQLCGAVTDIDAALRSTLGGKDGSAAAVQAAWAETLGIRKVSPSGVVASGKFIELSDLDPATLKGEIPEGARISHYVEVKGNGPDPLQLFVPIPEDGSDVVVYRRVEKGLFVEPSDEPRRVGRYLRVQVRWPGRFVVHQPSTPGEGKLLFPESPEPVDDPALKWHWRVTRVAPLEAVGPIPLLLIHGAGTDRWQEFIDWVQHSAEASEFRSHFQVWSYIQLTDGINAPIGFDPTCPRYEESIVAYLYRLLEKASTEGVATDNTIYTFPADGPMAILSDSHGALKARAFMVNYPEYGDRVIGAIALGGPNMGTPWATPEWMRHTASRIGLLNPSIGERLVEDAIASNYLSTKSQSDLDMGWGNYDAAGSGGIPYIHFNTWTGANGNTALVLSPRDANRSDARTLPGFDDYTFEPQEPLGTWCGGLDRITPQFRGDRYADKFFLYGSYIERNRGWLAMLQRAGDGLMDTGKNRFENSALRLINVLMGFVASDGGDWPASPYRVGDGFIPLQSQLMLDGKESQYIYETQEVSGWTVPRFPIRLNMDVINAHTLANPERIRIWPGWTHLDTVTGRYNQATGHSELFDQIGQDLISVLPENGE